MEHAGAEVRVAGSVRDALAIVPSWAPDVVLSDIEMPGEDGYGLLERIRRVGATTDRAFSTADLASQIVEVHSVRVESQIPIETNQCREHAFTTQRSVRDF